MVKSFRVYESSLGMFDPWVPLDINLNPFSRSTCYYDGGLTKTFRDTNMLKNKLTFLSLFVGQPLIHFLPVHRHLDQVCWWSTSSSRLWKWEEKTGECKCNWSVKGSSVRSLAVTDPASSTTPELHWHIAKPWFYTSLKNCHLNKWPKQPFHKQQTTIDKNRLTLLDQCKVAVKGLSANDSLSASGRQWTFRDSPRAGSPLIVKLSIELVFF